MCDCESIRRLKMPKRTISFLHLLALSAGYSNHIQSLRKISRPSISRQNLRMSEISDRDLLISLKSRIAQMEAEKAMRMPPFMLYDARKTKSLYYANFNRSKSSHIGEYEHHCDNEDEDGSSLDDIDTPFENDMNTDRSDSSYPGSFKITGEPSIDALDGNGSLRIKQLYFKKALEKSTPCVPETHSRNILPSLIPEKNNVCSWLSDDLNLRFNHYFQMAQTLRGIDQQCENTWSPRTRIINIFDTIKDSFDGILKEKEAGFLQRAEVKHSRAAMISFFGMTMNSLLINAGMIDNSAVQTYQPFLTFTAVMIVLGSAFETNLFGNNDSNQTLENRCSAAAIGSMSALAEYIRGLLSYPSIPINDKHIIDGNTLTMLAQRAEIGHGRLAIIAIAAMSLGLI